jgi:hypothetical protein
MISVRSNCPFALIDAEIGRQLHRAAHARRHIDERSVGEHRRIERGEGIVADRHHRSEILLHQFGSEIGVKRMPALASSAVRNRIKHGIDCDALIAAGLAIRAGVAGSSSIV